MKKIFLFLLCLFSIAALDATLFVGTGASDITPPRGTPFAGYFNRQGKGMIGTCDPLLATTVFIDNGKKQIVFCGVDHLGFDYSMVQAVKNKIHQHPELEKCEIFVSSSHTHAGGGAFLNIPILGEALAGPFNSNIQELYIDGVVDATIQAYENQQPAKIGIGRSTLSGLSYYRAHWPLCVTTSDNLCVIKVTTPNDEPVCVLFNFALHPTTLSSANLYFSADFVGIAREELQRSLGNSVQPIYFNGAQAELIPSKVETLCTDLQLCEKVGNTLAVKVKELWDGIETQDSLELETSHRPYSFTIEPTKSGLKIPLETYDSELNLVVINGNQAFITIPGELSCLYEERLNQFAKELGYEHLTIFGLTNDAHGYIIPPESWHHGNKESHLSFGGEKYGGIVEKMIQDLLTKMAPTKEEIN